MATQPAPQPEPRIPLSRERVLRAAIALADEGGLESLSMRKLGQQLGVEAMSLYHHVANKDDLLDGIVDAVTSEIEVPSDETDWKDGDPSDCDLVSRHFPAPPLGLQPVDAQSQGQSGPDALDGGAFSEHSGRRASRRT